MSRTAIYYSGDTAEHDPGTVEDEDKGRKGTQQSMKIKIKWFDQDDQEGGGGSVQLE